MGHSAGTGHHLNRVGIDAGGLQARQQPLGEKVGAERRNHVHWGTQFGDGHRLVGALASVEHIEAAAKNGLARGREAVGTRHQVDIDATDYQQLLLHAVPPPWAVEAAAERISLLGEMYQEEWRRGPESNQH